MESKSKKSVQITSFEAILRNISPQMLDALEASPEEKKKICRRIEEVKADIRRVIDANEAREKKMLEEKEEAVNKNLTKLRKHMEDRKNAFAGIDLSGAKLEGMDFSGMNLKGANFSSCKFKKCNFKNANLTGANLSGSNASRIDWTFEGAILTNANLTGTPLSEEIEEREKQALETSRSFSSSHRSNSY